MLFITVPRTGKLLLEFVSNSDSQSLGGYGNTGGEFRRGPQKTVHVERLFHVRLQEFGENVSLQRYLCLELLFGSSVFSVVWANM